MSSHLDCFATTRLHLNSETIEADTILKQHWSSTLSKARFHKVFYKN